MSRATQYIGLTNDALKFVKKAYKVENIPNDYGMFEEGIPLRRYFLSEKMKEVNAFSVFEEKVQYVPWSSGPMYFTCLVWYLHKTSGQIIEMGECFNWVHNPGMRREIEFDEKKGHYRI